MTPAQQLSRKLGHGFADPRLLQLALTHRSAGGEHNERLEFLGDAILGFAIAEALYRRFPRADEGQLSRLRASLVRRETLAEIAQELQLSDCLHMGAGELNSGGQHRTSTLADATEALLGAVYLDGGMAAAQGLIERLFQRRLDGLNPKRLGKDPKTRLQEWLQARAEELPSYEVTQVIGEQHNQQFHVSCQLPDGGRHSQGRGSSRRRAEQAAASAMLEQLGVE
ncbi:MAG: ribonuclease III [Gammaproteobacteria bacterium SHHR-1]|uniref:ribonuclease III n=1 Tax=Magnetovirga frankeli TaxID=947516 RepID=UPI001292EE45|nr:ribonuclease III [gamma proteobacterium SS-5]